MARGKAKVGAAQKLTGYVILAVLGLITVGLLIQQSRFNPAVIVALRAPELTGRPQAAAGQAPGGHGGADPRGRRLHPPGPHGELRPGKPLRQDRRQGRALPVRGLQRDVLPQLRSGGRADKTHVDVFLYDMGSAQNAYAVFSGQRRPGSPSSSLTANAYATTNALFFTQGRFYVEIVADRAAETLQKSLEAYATALLAKLPAEGETKDAAALFPKEGLARDTVRLCAADTFGCEGLNNMLTGEYSLKGGKATAFMAAARHPGAGPGGGQALPGVFWPPTVTRRSRPRARRGTSRCSSWITRLK